MRVVVEHMPDDWMADWLREREVTVMEADGSNAVHRYQVIRVTRGETFYVEYRDMGRASLYDHDPLMVVAGGRTPVARVREIAEEARVIRPYADRFGVETPDIRALAEQVLTERYNISRRRSTVGPALVRQRS